MQVWKTDSIRWRMGARWGPCWARSAGGAHDGRAEAGDGLGELAAGIALVADDRLAAAQARGQQRERDLALGPVGGDSAAARGVPSGAQTRCRRMPQNQREWLRE